MVIGPRAQGLYSLKFHYCQNKMPGLKLPYSLTVSGVRLSRGGMFGHVWARVNVNVSSAGGSEGEEPQRLPVCSWNPPVPSVHLYGWSVLHRCHGLGVHTHEAQVHTADTSSVSQNVAASSFTVTTWPCGLCGQTIYSHVFASTVEMFKCRFWYLVLCAHIHRYSVFKIHWLMAALAFTKSISLVFHSVSNSLLSCIWLFIYRDVCLFCLSCSWRSPPIRTLFVKRISPHVADQLSLHQHWGASNRRLGCHVLHHSPVSTLSPRCEVFLWNRSNPWPLIDVSPGSKGLSSSSHWHWLAPAGLSSNTSCPTRRRRSSWSSSPCRCVCLRNSSCVELCNIQWVCLSDRLLCGPPGSGQRCLHHHRVDRGRLQWILPVEGDPVSCWPHLLWSHSLPRCLVSVCVTVCMVHVVVVVVSIVKVHCLILRLVDKHLAVSMEAV